MARQANTETGKTGAVSGAAGDAPAGTGGPAVLGTGAAAFPAFREEGRGTGAGTANRVGGTGAPGMGEKASLEETCQAAQDRLRELDAQEMQAQETAGECRVQAEAYRKEAEDEQHKRMALEQGKPCLAGKRTGGFPAAGRALPRIWPAWRNAGDTSRRNTTGLPGNCGKNME